MADLVDYLVSRGDPANVNVPTHAIAGKLVDGATTLADFTGSNAIRWPSVLSTLSVEQQDQIAQQVSNQIIQWRAAQGG